MAAFPRCSQALTCRACEGPLGRWGPGEQHRITIQSERRKYGAGPGRLSGEKHPWLGCGAERGRGQRPRPCPSQLGSPGQANPIHPLSPGASPVPAGAGSSRGGCDAARDAVVTGGRLRIAGGGGSAGFKERKREVAAAPAFGQARSRGLTAPAPASACPGLAARGADGNRAPGDQAWLRHLQAGTAKAKSSPANPCSSRGEAGAAPAPEPRPRPPPSPRPLQGIRLITQTERAHATRGPVSSAASPSSSLQQQEQHLPQPSPSSQHQLAALGDTRGWRRTTLALALGAAGATEVEQLSQPLVPWRPRAPFTAKGGLRFPGCQDSGQALSSKGLMLEAASLPPSCPRPGQCPGGQRGPGLASHALASWLSSAATNPQCKALVREGRQHSTDQRGAPAGLVSHRHIPLPSVPTPDRARAPSSRQCQG